MIKLGFKVAVERSCGENARISDQAYVDAGCSLASTEEIYQSDVILKVRPPQEHPVL